MVQTLDMNDYNALERPRVQSIPSFYGDQLIDGVVIRDLYGMMHNFTHWKNTFFLVSKF